MKKLIFFLLSAFIISSISNISSAQTPEENLFNAIARKDIKLFNKSIKKVTNINARNSKGYNYLHALFSNCSSPFLTENETKILNILIQKGCDVNAVANNEYKTTVLEGAIGSQDTKAIKTVLDAGANVHNGYPLHIACFKRSLSAVQLLVDKGVDVNKLKNNEHALVLLLKYAGSPQTSFKILKLLHEHGADIFVRDANGMSLLDLANINNNTDAANYLSENGVKAYVQPIASKKDKNNNKNNGFRMSRKFVGHYYNDGEINESVILVDIAPTRVNIYDEAAQPMYLMEIRKTTYTTYDGLDAIEFEVFDGRGYGKIIVIKVPGLSTDGYNRLVFVFGEDDYITWDAVL